MMAVPASMKSRSSTSIHRVHRLWRLCAGMPGVRDFRALDDLPEKWKQFTEINASYVQGEKFTPAAFAKHQAAK